MRHALPAATVLAVSLGACVDDTRTIEVDVDELYVPMGAGAEVAVLADGHELSRLDAFSWVVDDPSLVTVTLTGDRSHVRITGQHEGDTVVHLGYRTAVIDVPTYVMPAAVVALTIDPASVTTPVGVMVPVHATATYTTGEARDVTTATAWRVDDPSIARLDAGGVVGMATGQTVLRATIDDTERTVAITIAAP